MDEDALARRLVPLTSKQPARRPGLEPHRQAPEEDDLRETLRCLHDAYADDDEVPAHLEQLARRVADAYLRLDDGDGEERSSRGDA